MSKAKQLIFFIIIMSLKRYYTENLNQISENLEKNQWDLQGNGTGLTWLQPYSHSTWEGC